MKQFKYGFTMAELLLSIAIIGVVSAMGMTIAKHSSEKAYNLFYYNGYINLYNAIADAKAESKDTKTDIMQHVNELLNKDPAAEEINNVGDTKYFRIDMTVPQAKTRSNDGHATIGLLYINDEVNSLLVPLVPNNANVPNLQNRRDLLPTYIDDGLSGRTKKVGNSYEYTSQVYYSYREAYCRLYRNQSLTVDGVTVINCAGIPLDNNARGFLKVADPRTAR